MKKLKFIFQPLNSVFSAQPYFMNWINNCNNQKPILLLSEIIFSLFSIQLNQLQISQCVEYFQFPNLVDTWKKDQSKLRIKFGLLRNLINILLYKDKKIENMSEVTLPDNFADKMFQLEAILEYQSTIQAIRQLNDLYRIGIDYYVQRQPKKATHLQKKMTALLGNPDNIRILERQSKRMTSKNVVQSSPSIIKNEPQTKKLSQTPTLNTRKLKQEITKFHTVAETCIQTIVQNSNKMADKIQKLKKKDLNKQEEQLNDRIMLKRVRSQEKFRLAKLGSQKFIGEKVNQGQQNRVKDS